MYICVAPSIAIPDQSKHKIQATAAQAIEQLNKVYKIFDTLKDKMQVNLCCFFAYPFPPPL